MPRVLLAVRHPELGAALHGYLSDCADLIVGKVTFLEELWNTLAREWWDILTFDLHDPVTTKADTVRRIHLAYPTLPILVLCSPPSADPAHWARAGARGVVSKGRLADDLVEAIHTLSRGAVYFRADTLRF